MQAQANDLTSASLQDFLMTGPGRMFTAHHNAASGQKHQPAHFRIHELTGLTDAPLIWGAQ